MILKYKLATLVLLLGASLCGSLSSQNENSCLRDIYGDAVTIDPGDSTILMVYSAPITCTGCKSLLVQYLQSLGLTHCQVIFIYNGRGGIVYKKARLDNTRQWINHSQCYFYFSNECDQEATMYTPFLGGCGRSPCLAVLRDGQLHVFNSDQMFLESTSGMLQFKEPFLSEFEKLVQ